MLNEPHFKTQPSTMGNYATVNETAKTVEDFTRNNKLCNKLKKCPLFL